MDRCLAHLSEAEFGSELSRIAAGAPLDARGVRFPASLLQELIEVLPEEPGPGPGHRFVGPVCFDYAVFEGESGFSFTTFSDKASFSNAIFSNQDEGPFYFCTFKSEVWFFKTQFTAAGFFESNFIGKSIFDFATVEEDAWFRSTTFHQFMSVRSAVVNGEASFVDAHFLKGASFSGSSFGAAADFQDAVFESQVSFSQTSFKEARQLGPLSTHGVVYLDSVTFAQRATIEVVAALLTCRDARFQAGIQIYCGDGTKVILDGTDFDGPSIVAGRLLSVGVDINDEDPGDLGTDEGDITHSVGALPVLMSIRQASVGQLTIGSMDLRQCLFKGAHNLNGLRIEGDCLFAHVPPGGWRTSRELIAEEYLWRRRPVLLGKSIRAWRRWLTERRRADWRVSFEGIKEDQSVDTPRAIEVCSIYRSLRKGREDYGDSPGAADFYYGEMEMRRAHVRGETMRRFSQKELSAGIAASVEYGILFLYWLLSGHSLRAWRAIAALAILILSSSLIFLNFGFMPGIGKESFAASLIYAVRVMVNLRVSQFPQLTWIGQVQEVIVRIFGVVLLSLAVLAVRGRVRR